MGERNGAAPVADGDIAGAIDDLAAILAGPGVPPDRGGARDLIAAVLDKPRFWPTANGHHRLAPAVMDALRVAAGNIRAGMPFAYAVGKASFRHLTLAVDRRVLIPRPETEVLVDLALAATGGRGVIADIGTGSGAIALALAAEGDFESIVATDLSADALAVAKQNLAAIPADRRGRVAFRQGDLLDPVRELSFTAVISNPPYIALGERSELPALVRDWEPAGALFAGDDGMAVIDRLIAGAADVVQGGGFMLLEIDARRAELARTCAETNGRWSDVQLRPDLTGRDRFLVARRSPR